MPLFRKKPVTIEARHYANGMSSEEFMSLAAWMESYGYPWLKDFGLGQGLKIVGEKGIWLHPADGCLMIRTLEGDMRVNPGSWIIRGVKGEFYPCREDIFTDTYESAEV